MEELIIVGTGVHSVELVEIVERINAHASVPAWRVAGFIAAAGEGKRVGQRLAGLPVLGTAGALREHPGCCISFAWDFDEPVEVPRERWATLVDPSCFVSRTAQLGRGCVLYPHCFVGLHARLGDRVMVLSGSIINHDDVLGDRVTVGSGVSLAGSVVVEDRCYLGQGCTVRQHARIGAGSMIGMGSVVLRDVPAKSVMVGNPARRLRENG